jgi:diacylglycerol kinase (ATP)
MSRYQVILNPVAGHGNGLRARPRIESLLAAQGLDFSLVQTERRLHATELTLKAAAAGFDVVVAAGGDGTINEVINGLMAIKQAGGRTPALGVLCVGRGNDLACGVDVPVDLEQACQALAANRRRLIDVGRVWGGTVPEGRYFGNCVGVGFDAIGTIRAARLPRWGGFASFLVAILETIFLYNHAPLATIKFGGQTITQRSLMISVMNGKRIGGGGFIMAPQSRPDDGLLDLCIAQQMSSLRILGMVPHFMKGTQASQPEIKTGKSAHVTITAEDGPLPAQMDGEIISTEGRRLEIELLPGQLEIVYQANG